MSSLSPVPWNSSIPTPSFTMTSRRLITTTCAAAGSLGMVGGQTMDILSQGKEMDPRVLEYIHSHKTGALIAAAVSAGAIIGGASAGEYRALNQYGEKLGL